MNSDIKKPIFIISEDVTVIVLNDLQEVDCCGLEPIDVADGVYTAYDSEGQILRLVTINEKNKKIERPTEDIIKIPFVGKIIGIVQDRTIKVILEGRRDVNKLFQILSEKLSKSGHDTNNLTLKELVALYQKEYEK